MNEWKTDSIIVRTNIAVMYMCVYGYVFVCVCLRGSFARFIVCQEIYLYLLPVVLYWKRVYCNQLHFHPLHSKFYCKYKTNIRIVRWRIKGRIWILFTILCLVLAVICLYVFVRFFLLFRELICLLCKVHPVLMVNELFELNI